MLQRSHHCEAFWECSAEIQHLFIQQISKGQFSHHTIFEWLYLSIRLWEAAALSALLINLSAWSYATHSNKTHAKFNAKGGAFWSRVISKSTVILQK